MTLADEASLYLCTPTHDARFGQRWVAGMLSTYQAFQGRIRIDYRQSSILPQSRDFLLHAFLKSGASHVLMVDSDMGWKAEDVVKLIDTGRDFVSGVYCRKNHDNEPVYRLLLQDGRPKTEDGLVEAEAVGAGFVVMTRDAVQRMTDHYRALGYPYDGERLVALWSTAPGIPNPTHYDGEDFAFCYRWRAMGGHIWLHPDVVLSHRGEIDFRPDIDWTTGRPRNPVPVSDGNALGELSVLLRRMLAALETKGNVEG